MTRARLHPVPASGGLYRGTIELDGGPGGADLGEHRVALEVAGLPGYSARTDRASVGFLLEEAPSPEAGDLTCDSTLLQEMVRRAAPGGKVLPIHRAGELAALIPDRAFRREVVTTSEQWVLAWPLLLLFALLVTAEWVLRKRFDLA